jgi:hypothetical protein
MRARRDALSAVCAARAQRLEDEYGVEVRHQWGGARPAGLPGVGLGLPILCKTRWQKVPATRRAFCARMWPLRCTRAVAAWWPCRSSNIAQARCYPCTADQQTASMHAGLAAPRSATLCVHRAVERRPLRRRQQRSTCSCLRTPSMQAADPQSAAVRRHDRAVPHWDRRRDQGHARAPNQGAAAGSKKQTGASCLLQ